MEEDKIEEVIENMRTELVLDEEEFNQKHPFSGSKYIEYFGKDREFGTIFGKGLNAPAAVKELYEKWVTNILDLSEEQRDLFLVGKEKKRGPAREYIENYLWCYKHWDKIQAKEIQKKLNTLQYPIIFYDYETISVPVPMIQGTSPYEQVVVQYSMHKVYEDGRIEHFWGILDSVSNTASVRTMDIPNNTNAVDYEVETVVSGNYTDLISQFLHDIAKDLTTSSFVVWYKAFENSRNKEIAQNHPEFATAFETINENTFDLMDIFKENLYCSYDFRGSNSIKYVLPALVPSMDYEGMQVANGSVAMKQLQELIEWQTPGGKRESVIQALLLYCGQDSLAMVRIWQELKRKINAIPSHVAKV